MNIDQWEEDRSTGHVFFRKTLPTGEVLETHRSHSGSKTMSPGRFRAILAYQLKVSVAEFWAALRTKRPVSRPSPAPEAAPRSLPAWLALALEQEVGVLAEEIERLSAEEAQAMLDRHRSRPRGEQS